MRGAEIVVGAVILTMGLIGIDSPGAPEVQPGTEPLHGNLLFQQIKYDGTATVTASEGAILADGPVKGTLAASRAVVTVFRYTYGHVDVPGADFHTGAYNTTEHAYRDVQMQIKGSPNGLIVGWIPEGDSKSSFELDLMPRDDSTIHASASTTHFSDRHNTVSYRPQGPTYATSHGGQGIDRFDVAALRLGDADFDRLTASGRLVLVVESATLDISHVEGHDAETLRDDPVTPGAPWPLRAGTMTYAVVQIPHGSFQVDFDETNAIFVSRAPTWHVNGTTTIEALEGRLSSGASETDVIDRDIGINGNTTLALQVEGDHDGSTRVGRLNFGGAAAITEEPRSEAEIDSTDWHATIDGVPLEPSGAKVASPSVVEEATLIAKVLGTLVLVWAAARWFLLFIIGMVAEKPLANPRRRQIYAVLQREGMSHVRDLERATGIPLGTLLYHLSILRQGKLVQSVERSRYRVYYVPSAAFCQDEIRRLALLADPTRRDICQALKATGDLSQEDLELACGVSRGQIARQLHKLVAEDLVERKGTRNARYRLAGLTSDWLSVGRQRTHTAQSRACASGDASSATGQGS